MKTLNLLAYAHESMILERVGPCRIPDICWRACPRWTVGFSFTNEHNLLTILRDATRNETYEEINMGLALDLSISPELINIDHISYRLIEMAMSLTNEPQVVVMVVDTPIHQEPSPSREKYDITYASIWLILIVTQHTPQI